MRVIQKVLRQEYISRITILQNLSYTTPQNLVKSVVKLFLVKSEIRAHH